MKKISQISCALLVGALGFADAAVGTLVKLQETGPRSNRLNIVMVAESYTAADSSKFMTDLGKMKTAIVSDPVLNRYSSYMNIYGVYVKSNQSGADGDNITTDAGCTTTTPSAKDTYFNAKYCSGNIQRLLTADGTLANTVALGHVPEAQIVAVIVNSSIYGGAGGGISVANSGAPEIIAHEIGHSFVSLKDEYDYTAGYTPTEGINATAITDRNTIRWKNWILPATPLPTPETSTYNSVVGAFEGANYRATGWFRPMNNCRMKSNGVNLCSVCAEAWVLKIYQKVSTIDSASPSTGNVTWSAGTSLKVNPIVPSTGSPHQIKWYVDNTLTNNTSTTFTGPLTKGTHSVKAVVKDITPAVKDDPQMLLKDSVVWNVTTSIDVANLDLNQSSLGDINIVDPRGVTFFVPLHKKASFYLIDLKGNVQFQNDITGSGFSEFMSWPPLASGQWIVQLQIEGQKSLQKEFIK